MLHRIARLISVFAALMLLIVSIDDTSSVVARCHFGGWRAQDTGTGEFDESQFITEIYQLTYAGKRSGEGYYSADGRQMIFQAEIEADNPFYQMYVMDLETGETQRVSPGHGKTTCGWFHPNGRQVIFSSTQDDPDAKLKQRQEIEFRESGQTRRYAWDYDEHYEIVAYDLETKTYRKLTSELGYDAEGCYSPDGQLIVFASNRRGYAADISEADKKAFAVDRTLFMDIYVMNADGSNVRQLTDVRGYDGGCFFSADGKKIVWRRFGEGSRYGEVFTMNADGSEQKQITHLRATSFAPIFHPSGKYIMFCSNAENDTVFNLYLVDAEGKSPPIRVTNSNKFEGFPCWHPNGEEISWTSNRGADGQSQIYAGKWNHKFALKVLGLDEADGRIAEQADATSAAKAQETLAANRPEINPADLRRHVDYLCDERLAGRMSGSQGERLATAYVATYLESLGLEPAGDNGSWYQSFSVPAGAKLGRSNVLQVSGQPLELDKDWRPLAFSRSGSIAATEVVFAGYGLAIPAEGNMPEYNSFANLDVNGKWVLVLRYYPENVREELRPAFRYHADLRKKAMQIRDRGALGMIVVNGPNSSSRDALVPLDSKGSLAGTRLAAISVTDEVAAKWLQNSGRDLRELQTKLDEGHAVEGFALSPTKIAAHLEIEQVVGTGRNVIGRLKATAAGPSQSVVIGAHIDHLGRGDTSSSMARDDERGKMHSGADDNASGVAALLEIAQWLAHQKQKGNLQLKRDILFAAWSGEELGLFGSQHFVDELSKRLATEAGQPATTPGNHSIYPHVIAYLNMDMVGRYRDVLILQGLGSSDYWKKAVQKNVATRLTLKLSDNTALPTDATSFYQAGVPILSAFTGSHEEYHTPRDVPELLNYEGMSKVARLIGLIGEALATGDEIPAYRQYRAAQPETPRSAVRAYLGSKPDYAGDQIGVLLSGVTPDSPAEKAGLQAGDVIIGLAGKDIENIYDYTSALDSLRPSVETTIVIRRGNERLELKIVPARR